LILDVQLGDLTDEMAALLAFWKLVSGELLFHP